MEQSEMGQGLFALDGGKAIESHPFARLPPPVPPLPPLQPPVRDGRADWSVRRGRREESPGNVLQEQAAALILIQLLIRSSFATLISRPPFTLPLHAVVYASRRLVVWMQPVMHASSARCVASASSRRSHLPLTHSRRWFAPSW